MMSNPKERRKQNKFPINKNYTSQYFKAKRDIFLDIESGTNRKQKDKT